MGVWGVGGVEIMRILFSQEANNDQIELSVSLCLLVVNFIFCFIVV